MCLGNAEALTEALRVHSNSVEAAEVKLRDTPEVPCSSFEYSWGNFEDERAQGMRMVAACEAVKAQWLVARSLGAEPSSTLLVSHGGPTMILYRNLTGDENAPNTGYCGLFCYTWEASESNPESPGRWEVVLSANHDHLKEVEGATRSGPNDMKEQTKIISSEEES